ncbi:c-clamp [Homalodisca vitripennis]|nr:c-clamp [Homalodisca vitripennis]
MLEDFSQLSEMKIKKDTKVSRKRRPSCSQEDGKEDLMNECTAALVLMRLSCSPHSPSFNDASTYRYCCSALLVDKGAYADYHLRLQSTGHSKALYLVVGHCGSTSWPWSSDRTRCRGRHKACPRSVPLTVGRVISER